jgi:hypothetical protein
MSRPLEDSAPARGKGKVQLSTSVPEATRASAVALAKKRASSLSDVVTAALDRYCRESKRVR